MDIVKGNGNLLGDTVTTLAENVESNSFNGNVYDEEKINVVMDETVELYSLPNGFIPMKFTAPANGTYTFETLGDAQNEFSADKGTVTAVGNNSKLVVRLEQGEVFNFNSQSFEDKRAIYQMSAKFTPVQLGIGEETTLAIAPGKTEYFEFCTQSPQILNWSINSDVEVGVAVSYNGFSDFKIHNEVDYSPSGMLLTNEAGKYFFAITNESEQTVEIEAGLSEVAEVVFGSEIIKQGKFDQVVRFSPQYSSNYEVTLSSDIAIYGEIYNDNLGMLLQKSGTAQSFSVMMEGGKNYYIVMRHSVGTETHCNIRPISQMINFGENQLSKAYDTMLYQIRPFDTDVKANIECSAGNTAYFYDENMQPVEGASILSAGKQYYIGVAGTTGSFILNINLETKETVGEIGTTGFVLIAFTAPRDGQYIVSGWENYAWFTGQLQSLSNNFNAGEKYYLKLSGAAGSNYSVNIDINAPTIIAFENQNLSVGYYKFVADSTDSYIYKARCTNNAAVTFDLYSADHNLIASGIDAKTEGILQLDIGTYYFEIFISEGTRTTFRIIPQNGDYPLTRTFEEGKEISVAASAETLNVFTFTPSKDAEFYLKLYNTATQAEFDVSVYANGVKLQTQGETYEDRGVESYAVKMFLNDQCEYTIYVDCYQGEEESYNLMLFVPSRIESIKFNGNVVYSNDNQISKMLIAMGANGEFIVNYNVQATFKQTDAYIDSNNIVKDIVDINSGNLTIGFDMNAEGETLRIKFLANLNFANIDFTLQLPYYASATLNADYIYEINTTITPGANPAYQEPTSVTLNICGAQESFDTSTIDLMCYPILENTPISGSVTYQFDNYEYSFAVNEVNYIVNPISVTGNIDLTSPRVVIDYVGSNLTIRVLNSVKALFFNLLNDAQCVNAEIKISNVKTFIYI